MKELNAKQGRKRFVTKETNGNGNGNNRKGHIVSFVPSNSFTGNMDDLTTSNFRALKFDGVLMFEELSGCFGSAYLIEKGTVKKKLILTNIAALAVRDCFPVTIATDWYQYSSSAGETRNDAHYIGTTYSYGFECSATNYPTYDQDQAQGDYSSGGGGDSYYTEYLVSTTEANNWLRDNNDTTKLVKDPCAAYVYSKLTKESGNYLHQTLKGFFGEKPIIHLKWEVQANLTYNLKPVSGLTHYSWGDFSAKIILNSSYFGVNSPTEVAGTIIHEAIHAELYRKIQSIGGLSNLSDQNFPALFNLYENYSDPQHEHMANKYISEMSAALKAFDIACGFPIRNDSVYTAIAWGGLYETAAWTRLSETDRKLYWDLAEAERKAGGCPPL